MAAYVIFTRESTISEMAMQTYSELAIPTLGGHSVTPLAFYGSLDVLEGPNFEGAVVLQFLSMAAARAWYDSPAYQAARLHRKAGAEYRVFIVDGVPAPSSST